MSSPVEPRRASMQAFEQLLVIALLAGVVVPVVTQSLVVVAERSVGLILVGGIACGWHALTMRVRQGPTDAENYVPQSNV